MAAPATVITRSPRLGPRFWVALDRGAAAACALIIYGLLFKGSGPYSLTHTLWFAHTWLPPLLALCLSLPVAIRRRDPLLALALTLAACVATMAVGGHLGRGPEVPLALVLYMVAVRCGRILAVAALAVCLWLLAAQALVLHFAGYGSGDAIGIALVLIIIWLAGWAVAERRAYALRLREQVASAAVTEERLRIARDLHDVVAHSMTVVAVQAGFGEYVFDREPAQARAALGAIQQVTREALADMQRLLGVLRQGEQGAPRPERPLQLAPAPGLADLDRLVSTTAAAGVRVDVTSAGEREQVPAAIDQSAFRIVQEALTNVVKHSGADTCTVTVGYTGKDLNIEITDPGGQARMTGTGQPNGGQPAHGGTGHGITGMRERVSLCGGEFSAGPMPRQGFRVAARFPLNGTAR